MPGPFVARSGELQALGMRITAASERRGSVILISGEAGIGKTRLWQETIGRGVNPIEVLVGRAYPEERTIAFGPLADAIRNARRGGPPRLWAAFLARASVLSAVVPELAAEVGGTRRPLDAPVVFEALLEAAEDAAGTTGLAWVLEDLHWADGGTWSFVTYATRRISLLPLVLVVTYRHEEVPPTHAWWPRLAALRLHPDVVALPLERLSPAETEEMVGVLAPDLAEAQVADIVRRSAGTPLLVEELARGGVAARGAPGAVPDIVRATVRDRARRLDQAAAEIAEIIAVIGRDVDVGLLRELRPTETPAALDRLVESGLVIVSTGDGEGTVSFRHPLFLQALYEELPWVKRWELHDEVAAALEARADGHAPERVARHRELAGRPDAGLATLVRAADESRTKGQVGRAASLGLSALELTSRHSRLASQRDLIAPTVMADLFRSGRWTDLGPLVEDRWSRRESLDMADRAALANVLSLHLFYIGEVDRARSVAAEEVARLGAQQAPAGALLVSSAAFISWFWGDIQAAVTWGREALELAERSGDPEAVCRARNVKLVAQWRAQRDRQAAIEGHRNNLVFAQEAELSVGEANARWSLALLTIRTVDLAVAEEAAERAGTWYASPTRLVQGFLHVLEGRTSEARACFAGARAEICNGIPMMCDAVDTAEAHLHLHCGQLASARLILEAGAGRSAAQLPSWAAARRGVEGWLAWEEGRWGDAARLLGRSTQLALANSYHVAEMGPILFPLHVDALLELGRGEEAEALIEVATTEQDHDRFTAAAVTAARFRLLLDERAARSAAEQAAAAGWRWLEALVGCWRGRHLRDVAAAVAARETFEAVGAARGVERADAVLRQLGAPHRGRGPVRGAPLSGREEEVAKLVAEGLTNVEIGKRLFISRPTVATHVTHILTKLGFASRAQIAAWVAERRSAPPS